MRFVVFIGVVFVSFFIKVSRTKFSGSVRRFFMKMKKLSELRRRLSLRGSRVGRERERVVFAGFVISRYYLDSSVGIFGRAAVVGGLRGLRVGYFSDGDLSERLVGFSSFIVFRFYEVGFLVRGFSVAFWGRFSLYLYGSGGLRSAFGVISRDFCCLL